MNPTGNGSHRCIALLQRHVGRPLCNRPLCNRPLCNRPCVTPYVTAPYECRSDLLQRRLDRPLLVGHLCNRPFRNRPLRNRRSDLLQRRLTSPLLVGGRAFDVGLYALVEERVTGLGYSRNSGLTYWLFDDVLLRFCNLPYRSPVEAMAALEHNHSAMPELQAG